MKTQIQIPGINKIPEVYHNLTYNEIHEHEIKNRETTLTNQGAMAVHTGIYTGRSPKDKFIVKEAGTEKNIWWGDVNQAVSEEIFDELHGRVNRYLDGRALYVYDGFAGARRETRMSLRVVTEHAWQHHFASNMFIAPSSEELEEFAPEFTILNASGLTNPDWQSMGLHSEIFVIFHLSRKLAIIGGTLYGGEMKKGIFSVMNYYKPLEGILTMHCSANRGREKEDTALFFGLSGTGKTTLSTDPERPLIGDDEHGWDDKGIWNMEGGCYAKVIHLNPDDEPEIYGAIKQGALLENVEINGEGVVDYSSSRHTENTRVSYPLTHIENRIQSGVGGHPENIIFLTADAFGVLPPVSRLTPEQASYHFLSGYTAKVAGTERGVTEPVATFSPCFGAAFMTLHPTVYARLLADKIRKHGSKAWLVNTGWSGGPYGIGSRMKIKLTRSIIDGIFDGTLDHEHYTRDEVLNLSIPDHLRDIKHSVLHPWESWSDRSAYDEARKKLATMFIDNFKKFAEGEFDFTKFGPHV